MKRFKPEKYQNFMANIWSFPSDFQFIGKEKPFKTFTEVFDHFKNKQALFCLWFKRDHLCKNEFKHHQKLKTFLKSKDIELVYGCYNQNENDIPWAKEIKEHKLSGTHLYMNKQLYDDSRNLNISGYIPVYLLLDKNGKVKLCKKLKPKDGEKFYKLIESLL